MGKNHSHKSIYKWDTDKIVYKDKCFECDMEDVEIHFHHIIPEVKGGKKTIPLCSTCHGRVHDRNFEHHSHLRKLGIERAKLEGKFKGRAVGSKESIEKFLSKPTTINIIELMNKGCGPREIIRRLKVSPNSIYKVKKYMV
jgi:hypothetical protein